MTEVNTFSAAVDDTLARSLRKDRIVDIYSYVRSTLRECHGLAYFRNDFIEDTITTDAVPFIWTTPTEFRLLRTVRYPIFNRRGEQLYPDEIKPGKRQRETIYYYYGGPGYYAFAGLSSGVAIDVGYYGVTKKLPYYALADRPATFSLEDDAWSYKTATSDAEKLIAREQVSNWLLYNYYDTIIEGTLAKLFKAIDDPRARSSFALYKSYQNTLKALEPSDSLNK